MKKTIALFLLFSLLFTLCACGKEDNSPATQTSGETSDSGTLAPLPTVDPSGNAISVPETIKSVIVLAPSIAETLVALGQGDKIIGYDLYSVGIEGLPEGVPTFDTVNPDVEQLMALAPDVLLVSSLSLYDQEAPYQPLISAGICVICVPTCESIEGVKSDIKFLADVFRVPEAGESVLTALNTELDRLASIAATIPENERKSVYFEISAAPYLYSSGGDTYLNEMIEWIGAKNVFADQKGWLSVEAETVVAANPDVIFTNVNYLEDPVQEILSREGWAGITAIANGNVYSIDNSSSSLPNQNIVVAMRQMAEALYPDYFGAQ